MDETLKKRLFSSVFFIALTVATIFLTPEWFFFLIVQVFNLVALYEYLLLIEKKEINSNRWICLIFGALIPFSLFYSAEILVLSLATLVLFVLNFQPRKKEKAFLATLLPLFGIFYVSGFFSYLVKIRHLEDGAAFVFYTILLVKAGDAGAYFVGSRFGKTKLIEHISPKKSVEGAIGGFATTIFLSLLSKAYLPLMTFTHLFFLGAIIGVISQLGDLVESLIKRDVGVKDSGQIPGLGGVLDVLDSLIFTIPFVYYYLAFLVF